MKQSNESTFFMEYENIILETCNVNNDTFVIKVSTQFDETQKLNGKKCT
jgi:hypothetical protein